MVEFLVSLLFHVPLELLAGAHEATWAQKSWSETQIEKKYFFKFIVKINAFLVCRSSFYVKRAPAVAQEAPGARN